MAKNDSDGRKTVDDSGTIPVVAVEVPDKPSDEWHRDQAEKQLDYRVTGVNRGYIDQSRDQEPDIAPEFGASPHPELFNPRPPDVDGLGIGRPAHGPVVEPFEEKQKAAEDEEKRVKAAAKQASSEKSKDAPARKVSEADALNLHLTPDESPKARDTKTES